MFHRFVASEVAAGTFWLISVTDNNTCWNLNSRSDGSGMQCIVVEKGFEEFEISYEQALHEKDVIHCVGNELAGNIVRAIMGRKTLHKVAVVFSRHWPYRQVKVADAVRELVLSLAVNKYKLDALLGQNSGCLGVLTDIHDMYRNEHHINLMYENDRDIDALCSQIWQQVKPS